MNIELKLNLLLSAEQINNSALSECQRYIIESCLLRSDYRTARILLKDWRITKELYITQWVQGTHYYVLREKFDTYELAKAYAIQQGYRILGVRLQQTH